jgi:hypothetical protein
MNGHSKEKSTKKLKAPGETCIAADAMAKSARA